MKKDQLIHIWEHEAHVPENQKMMESSHFQPPIDSAISAGIHEFNRKEEQEATS